MKAASPKISVPAPKSAPKAKTKATSVSSLKKKVMHAAKGEKGKPKKKKPAKKALVKHPTAQLPHPKARKSMATEYLEVDSPVESKTTWAGNKLMATQDLTTMHSKDLTKAMSKSKNAINAALKAQIASIKSQERKELIKKGGPGEAVAVLAKQVGRINALAKMQEQRAKRHNKSSFLMAKAIRKDAAVAAAKSRKAKRARDKAQRAKARAAEASDGWKDAQDAVRSAEKGLAAMMKMESSHSTKTMTKAQQKPLTDMETSNQMGTTTKVATKVSTKTKAHHLKSKERKTKARVPKAQVALAKAKDKQKEKKQASYLAKAHNAAIDDFIPSDKEVQSTIKEAYNVLGTPLIGGVPAELDPDVAAATAGPSIQNEDLNSGNDEPFDADFSDDEMLVYSNVDSNVV